MKLWSGRFGKETDALVNDFNASIQFDQRLYREDITGSMAHAKMLGARNHSMEDVAPFRKPPGILGDGGRRVEFTADTGHSHDRGGALTAPHRRRGKRLLTPAPQRSGGGWTFGLFRDQIPVMIGQLLE